MQTGRLLSANFNLTLLDESAAITIPGSAKSIGEGALANVEGVKIIIIPGTCKKIEKNAFAGNKTVEHVIMRDGVQEIGVDAFSECSNLKTVEMPNSVTTLGDRAFQQNSSLTTINISSGLTIIPRYVFYECTNLQKITLPGGIRQIQAGSFSGCRNLSEINIPSSVETIDIGAFNRTSSLEKIVLEGENTNFTLENGILFRNDENNEKVIIVILASAIKGNSFTIPKEVKSLESNILENYPQITEIEIPSTVTSIAADFINENITKVTINNENEYYESDGKAIYTKGKEKLVKYYANEEVVTIDEGTCYILECAFKNQKNITQINLPKTLVSIGGEAFSRCNKLTNIHLGENVKEFNSLSIYFSGIETVTIDENNPNFSVRDGALYNKDGTIFISPLKKTGTIKEYIIPEGVKEIEKFAFHNQNQMTSIVLPTTLEKIGNSFNYCRSLTTVTIPSSVTKINKSCFGNCGNNLKEIIVNKPRGSISGAPWGCIYGDRAINWNG